jgi:DNA-binding MurR/RpiR family transcriptional regulator
MSAAARPDPPRDFRGLRDLLLRQKDALPRRLAQVAAFAIANPDDVAFGTAAGLAERAAVQPSTLIRFAQALGYSGFSELQDVFRERLRDRPASYADRLEALRAHRGAAPDPVGLFAGFADAAGRSLAALGERLDGAALDGAVVALARAETIYLLAQRRSYPVATSMNYAFGNLGVKNLLLGSAAGTDAEAASFATPRDAAVAISFAPYAPATLHNAQRIAAQGAPVVAITDSPFSPLVACARHWIEVVEADYEGFRSLAATMALATSLTVAVAQARRAAGVA